MNKKRPFSSLIIDIPTINENDLVDQLTTHSGSSLLLGMFSANEIRKVLEKVGILSALREKGIDDFIIKIHPIEDFDQVLKIYSQKTDKAHQLAEVRLKEGCLSQPAKSSINPDISQSHILSIEWMMMQNPFKEFSPHHPGLPGQDHPGLGQARKVLKLIIAYCRLKNLDGVVNFPEYYHNAFLYREVFKFYDPCKEAEFRAVLRDISHLSLAEMSWAVNTGCIVNMQNNSTYDWVSDIQIFPLNENLQQYFQSAAYLETYNTTFSDSRFIVDEEKFKNIKNQPQTP
ncbi:MAG: hypothetical protein DWQ05_10090 [Calditrichaeota bacterium]|nr:MAG: hypothetical protein DWQ05_10090 [Calditrichota bacterium]